MEPTLFGHVKGAFTGAATTKAGFFEDAGDGTLFLDEIGELPLDMQAKMLRVLENGEYQRVGETQRRAARCRVIAATNRDLRRAVREGSFRADLYHRLSVFTLSVPPLRELENDKLLLLEHFRRRSERPFELDEAARVEGCSPLMTLWKVYVPLARPTYVAYALVSVSYHWNNFLWPLIITDSVESRPVTVGLQVFSSTDQGIDWSIICAATLLTTGPLLVAFLLFQRQFVQSFMRAGIR